MTVIITDMGLPMSCDTCKYTFCAYNGEHYRRPAETNKLVPRNKNCPIRTIDGLKDMIDQIAKVEKEIEPLWAAGLVYSKLVIDAYCRSTKDEEEQTDE